MNKSLRKILLGATILAGTMMPLKNAQAANNNTGTEKQVPWRNILLFAGGIIAGCVVVRPAVSAWHDTKFQKKLKNTMGAADYDNDDIKILYFDTSELLDKLSAREARIIVEDGKGNLHIGGTLKREFFENITQNLMKDSVKQNHR